MRHFFSLQVLPAVNRRHTASPVTCQMADARRRVAAPPPARFARFSAGFLSKGALALALAFLSAGAALAQTGVGIGTTAPDVSAALDIVSSSKGALLPRVAAATAIVTPATGLLVFQTGAPAGFYYNAGTPGAPSWQQIATASGAAVTASNGLTKTGNNLALGGTLTGATTIAQGGRAFSLTGGNVGIGTSNPAGLLTVQNDVFGVNALDQQQLATNAITGADDFWQSFTANVTGNLTQFDLLVGSPLPPSAVPGTLSVYAGQGTGGTLLTTQAIVYNSVGGGVYQPYLLTTPVAVVAGQQYTYRFQTTTLGVSFVSFSTANPYAGGQSKYSPIEDLCFKTYVTPVTTTAALAALASGLVGVGTNSPTQRLEVAGQVFSNTGGFRFPDNSIQTTAATTTPTTTASNGLTKTGNDLALGGPLTGATTITQAGNSFSLTGGSVGIGTPTPTQRLEVAGQVFSNTGGFRFPDNSIQTTAATTTPTTTASNGLTKTGNNLALGGPLTAATTITQAGHPFSLMGGGVGVGTSSPGHPLAVQAVSGGAMLGFNNDAGTDKYNFSLTNGGLNLSESNVAAGRLFVQDGGQVGIGTTAPTQRLEVAGQVFSNTGGFRFPDNTLQTTAATTTPTTTASNGLTKTGNNIALGGTLTGATTIAQAGHAFSLTGGDVGIGTTTPTQKLDVTGNTNVTGNSYVSGNVGIGTTTPGQKLEVAGNIFANGEGTGFLTDNQANARVGLLKYGGREGGIWRTSAQDFEIGRVDAGVTALPGSPTTWTTDLYVGSTGQVGIGTSGPTAPPRRERQRPGAGPDHGRRRADRCQRQPERERRRVGTQQPGPRPERHRYARGRGGGRECVHH